MSQWYNVAKLQCWNFSKLQYCNDANLQTFKLSNLQCWNVAMLQCSNVAMCQSCNLVTYGLTYGWTGGLLELVSQLKTHVVNVIYFLQPAVLCNFLIFIRWVVIKRKLYLRNESIPFSSKIMQVTERKLLIWNIENCTQKNLNSKSQKWVLD